MATTVTGWWEEVQPYPSEHSYPSPDLYPSTEPYLSGTFEPIGTQ